MRWRGTGERAEVLRGSGVGVRLVEARPVADRRGGVAVRRRVGVGPRLLVDRRGGVVARLEEGRRAGVGERRAAERPAAERQAVAVRRD